MRICFVMLSLIFLLFYQQATMLKIGHRGASGYEPENTLRSFAKAIELGVDMIELDVHVCASGELVVIHDERVDRTTNGTGLVAAKTLQELKMLDAGKGERIPTLSEVLDFVNRKVKVNIELKGRGTAQPTAGVIEKYVQENKWSYKDFFVSSYNHHELRTFQQYLPQVKTGAIIYSFPIDYAAYAQELGSDAILAYENLNQAFVDDAHRRGLRVFVYTLNYPEDIAWVKSLGVEGIITDFPDRL